MRKVLAVAALATALSGLSAAPALAGPVLPDPTDCHSVNAFLHIDNVRDCNTNG